ncbi:hypothetical protein BDA96_02G337600 [Sorghum bicolor]|uniref:Uncharacterized protein n=2 Tax=Sorghum bicolor TaxID=4558 RepID=A0A921UUH9_SORBI|nr:hypothetical protein BDA96_02G337600 [Sorghum bicolor]KXG36362.1 hypothetical protein SORBI_3002G321600 [Sorghum bicolor]
MNGYSIHTVFRGNKICKSESLFGYFPGNFFFLAAKLSRTCLVVTAACSTISGSCPWADFFCFLGTFRFRPY